MQTTSPGRSLRLAISFFLLSILKLAALIIAWFLKISGYLFVKTSDLIFQNVKF